MSTIKQRKKAIESAVKAMTKAADALAELQSICIDYDVNMETEERFASDLRERAGYWDSCTWWQ